MKSFLVVVLCLWVCSGFALSLVPPTPTVDQVVDSSFADQDVYLRVVFGSAVAACGTEQVPSCSPARRDYEVRRGNLTEEKLKEVKKLVYLAFTLKKGLQFSVLSGSNVFDLSKPIAIKQEQGGL